MLKAAQIDRISAYEHADASNPMSLSPFVFWLPYRDLLVSSQLQANGTLPLCHSENGG